ncbi:MAG: DUF1801 domain-containing protein [Thermoplasmata archaeon]|nr:DUF1801 domain-containing protein [Thermoplasmata archaeon]
MTRRDSPAPEVDRTIAELAPPMRTIAQALQSKIRRTAPELRETLMWQNPVWRGRKPVLCLMLYDDHVNLGLFHGAKLTTKYRRLEGTGKGMRHMKVRSVDEAKDPTLAGLIRDAVKLDELGP